MLKLSSTFIGTPVLSLRTGSPVANTTVAIINPNNLKIEGFFVEDNLNNKEMVLLSDDIRDVLPQGLAINDYEVFSETDDLVRLKDIIELKFELIDKTVATESGKKLGKVSDYAVETKSMIIKKLYAAQPIIKNLKGGSISIDRTQIIEITNRRIVIEDPAEKAEEEAKIRAAAPSEPA